MKKYRVLIIGIALTLIFSVLYVQSASSNIPLRKTMNELKNVEVEIKLLQEKVKFLTQELLINQDLEANEKLTQETLKKLTEFDQSLTSQIDALNQKMSKNKEEITILDAKIKKLMT